MEILTTVFYIVICVMLFSLAIAIHEFGHFLAALKFGLRVERFSIGFGPAICKRTWRGVEYRLSWIPLGGYVMIPDIDPEGTKALEGGGSEKKSRIPAWKELVVAFAGPAMNLVLAFALAFLLSFLPESRFGVLPPEIGSVPDGGPAAEGGLKPGDTVLSINGHAVDSWTGLLTEVQIAGANPATFVVSRPAEDGSAPAEVELTVTPKRDKVSGAFYILALAAGCKTGHWLQSRDPWEQFAWDAGAIFRVLKGLVSPKEMKTTAQALGGPVMIAEGIYDSIRSDFWDGIGFLRFLNVNLAVVNLLPIPVLDGGLILFALIAIVFRRRVPDKVVGALSTCFMYLLLAAMATLIYRDSVRSWRIHRHAAESPLAVPPGAAAGEEAAK